MFSNQFQRVKDNILPFVLIGLFVGIFIGKASWFRSFAWINDYLKYSGINTYYPDSGQVLFFKHFGPDTLTFLLIAIFAFSAMNRIVLAVKQEGRGYWDIVKPLENFGTFLAVAWLGLILGITLPTLIYEGISRGVTFLVYIVYPLVFLVEVGLCMAFLSSRSLDVIEDYAGRYNKRILGVRVEGLVLFCLSVLMLTYQDKHATLIKSLVTWVKSAL